MKKHANARLTILMLITLSLTLTATPAFAAPPPNDNFADAASLNLGVSESVDITDATVEEGERAPCYEPARTVWYKYKNETAGPLELKLETHASESIHFVQLYNAATDPTSMWDLSFFHCADGYGESYAFRAEAGYTYYIQLGSRDYSWSGPLSVTLKEIPPPLNDDFADAVSIESLPHQVYQELSGATLELDEPMPECTSEGVQFDRSVWFEYIPEASGSISAWANSAFSYALAAYSRTELGGLTPVACTNWRMTFFAEKGVTYYFQLGSLYGYSGSLEFNLISSPPPTPEFDFWPLDPSIFDPIGFFSNSWDPVDAGWQALAWDFGDGVVAEGSWVEHRFAADGDYSVSLTCTTVDGRAATIAKTISVRTHDVAIVRLTAPQTAKVGQTRAVNVFIKNTRYDETNVQVELVKSTPEGWSWVGTLTQFVPVRGGNRTSVFPFSYTFTQDDAALEKMTFKATATIVDARDALPADNEAISSPPTRVNP